MEDNPDLESVAPLAINGESLVEQVRTELIEIDAMQVHDHAERFENLHQKLSQALSSIDGL